MAKYCTNCGTNLDDDADFCTNCGQAVSPQEEASRADDAATTTVLDTNAVTNSDLSGLDTMVTQAMPSADAPKQAPLPQSARTTPPTTSDQQPIRYGTPNQEGVANGQQPSNNRPAIIGVVLGAVIIILGVLVCFFVLNRPSDESADSTQEAAQGTAAQTFTVTYETGGGSTVSATDAESGDAITSPEDPVRNGYAFGGWFLDSSYTQPVAFPYTVEADTILYAKWTPQGDASNATATPSVSSSGSAFAQSNVELTVVGADGSTRTAVIHRQGSSGRVFTDSNSRLLSSSEINGLSDAERCVAWNEIIAASNGYEFKNSGLKGYFNGHCAWYTPNPSAGTGGALSDAASKNVTALKNATDDWWEHLAAN